MADLFTLGILALGGVFLFILGLLVGMASQRLAYEKAQQRKLTDWEGDQ